MQMTTISGQADLLQFARDAAADFNREPAHATYGDITPGAFLAIRWGLGDDCVLVLRQDEGFEPINFQQSCHYGIDAGRLLRLVLALKKVQSHEKGRWAEALAALMEYAGRFEKEEAAQ